MPFSYARLCDAYTDACLMIRKHGIYDWSDDDRDTTRYAFDMMLQALTWKGNSSEMCDFGAGEDGLCHSLINMATYANRDEYEDEESFYRAARAFFDDHRCDFVTEAMEELKRESVVE